ncbi:MAG: nucleotidyltransferase family protein [Candidatus Thermoplasmatota archaeon]
MSELEEIKEKLKEHKPELEEKYNISEIGIFGSYVREDHDEASDIDILVEFSEPIGWEIVDLKEELEELLNKSVDLVTKDALKPRLKSNIMDDVVYA